VTALSLDYSFRQYRLVYDITYDDCTYFVDAAKRLNIFNTEGFDKFFQNYLIKPPHSPLLSLVAMSGFSMWGFHDWVPYACNSVFLSIFLAFIVYLQRRETFIIRTLSVFFAATVPFASEAINVYRPEFSAGLFTAIGVFLITEDSLVESRTMKLLVAGACFGIAMVSKPPFFPLTLLIFCLSVLAAMVPEIVRSRPYKLQLLRQMLYRSMIPLTTAILVAGPHYMVAGDRIVAYIIRHQFGDNAHLWRYKASLSESFTYFLTGPGGYFMLGNHFWAILVVIAGSCLIGCYTLKTNVCSSSRWIFLWRAGFVSFVTYCFVSLNPHKQYCFGWNFQILIVLLTVSAIPSIVRDISSYWRAREKSKRWLQYPIWGLLVVFGLLNLRAATRGSHDDPAIRARAKMASTIMEVLGHESTNQPKKVFIQCGQGVVNRYTLEWVALREGLSTSFSFYSKDFSRSADLYFDLMNDADYVIAVEKGLDGFGPDFLPCLKFAEEFLLYLQQSPEFEKKAHLPTTNGKGFLLFRRRT
jgi:hypothetical protein